ncbi:DUF2252 domain-containing protein [Pseudoclavibacter soli]|uniref:DUF2252 domain-containing protein n=1 Tax=Pseudoclavibacter soli TaxID=452623 RepID=UPI0003F9B503|nr:DUF2252 domain-containing protein [Pseudoclavibacter soli]
MSRSIYGSRTGDVFASADQLRADGKRYRRTVPIDDLGVFAPADRDPSAILDAQNATRLPELVELRRERMSASAFSFYRGSARLMAFDLAHQIDTGQQIVICGDAHISNFGFFASPERRLVFDLNDFDEAAPGPWEWDVRRMITSVVVGARDRGFSADATTHLAMQASQAYRRAMRRLSTLSALDRYYESVDDAGIAAALDASTAPAFTRLVEKARRRTSVQAVDRLTEFDEHGQLQFREEPPVLTHLVDARARGVRELYREYMASAAPDIRLLLQKYRLIDGARRVVGVGSVGTRCFVVLLLDRLDQPLVLQIKEAVESVVTEFNLPNETTPATLGRHGHNGQRVVEHQRILQAVSDPFLGWGSASGHQFYLRQFRDMKGSVDLDRLELRGYEEYVIGCGLLLARAHAQSPAVHWIAGYLTKGVRFDAAMTRWANAYADQVAVDYQRYLASA